MRILRIWSDGDGVSHLHELAPSFEPVENYARGIPTVGISGAASAKDAYLLRMPVGFFGDWHPAPRHQLMAQMQGRLRVTMSDGVSVETGPDTLWHVDDLEGQGHQTEVLGGEDVLFLVVTMPEAFAE